jgi:hypothetical protein
MRRDSPSHARSVAPEPGRFHAKNRPRLPRPLCTARQKRPAFHGGTHGACEVRDVLLAIFPVTRTGSSPVARVVCNVVDRQDGREVHGRAPRRGRRGLCRRDHPRTAHGSLSGPGTCSERVRRKLDAGLSQLLMEVWVLDAGIIPCLQAASVANALMRGERRTSYPSPDSKSRTIASISLQQGSLLVAGRAERGGPQVSTSREVACPFGSSLKFFLKR